MKSAPRELCVSVTGALHGIGLKKLFRGGIVFQVSVPESQRSRIRIPQNGRSLRRAGREQRIRGDEGHVISAGDEQFIFLIRPAALKRNFVPRRAGHRTEAVQRTCYPHEWQRDFVE